MTTIPLTPHSGSTGVFRNARTTGSASSRRPQSPPASAYFPLFPEDPDGRPVASPGAQAHFSYSTTLRRHHAEYSPADFAAVVNAEATGLWSRFVSVLAGRRGYEEELEEGGRPKYTAVEQEAKGHSLSAKFAHCSVEVRMCCSLDAFHA